MDHKEAASVAAAIIGGLNRSQYSPSLIVQLCDYVTRPRTDPWRATSPVPDTPEGLRDFLLSNQLSDDARVKHLLGMCHAAIGELLAEVAKAKAAGVKPFTGERPALPPAPGKLEQLCAILSANKLTDDPYLRDLLDQCHGAMTSMDGEIKMLVEILKQVRGAAAGKQPSAYHPLVADVNDLYIRANAPRVDPWQAEGSIPDEPAQLCAFIINNNLTDDDRMQNLLLRCYSKILALLGQNKNLVSEQTKVEEALGARYWAGPDAPPELLHVAAKRIRGELDRIRSAALPEQVAAVAQQISEAKGRWDDGCGKEINEVFRPCDTLLDAVRVLASREEAAKACAIKAVEMLQREIAASLTPPLIEQAVKLGTRGNGLSATASPGPWVAERGLVHMAGFKAPEIADCAMRLERTKGRYNDADFIAEARSVVPEMSELLLCIAKKAGEGRVLPEEVAELIAAIDGPSPEAPPAHTKPAPDERADAYARMAGEQQREIERLDGELTAAKKHAAEAEERAAHNETRAVEEGHRVIAAERKYAELSAIIDQRLVDPPASTDPDLSDIDQLLDKTALLVTLCSGGPWTFSTSGDPIVMDADRRAVAILIEPTPGNLETRRYNGEFVAASRGLVVHLVDVCRRLVAGVRGGRINNAALQSIGSDKDKKIAAVTEELRQARADQDAAVQQKLAEAAGVVEQREADLKRLIGKQQAAAETSYNEFAATKERLHQTLAEVVFLRDCVDRVDALRLEAEAKLETANKELTKAIEDERFVSVAADRLRDERDQALATVAIKEKELADHDRRLALQHSRTMAADRLWQKDTGRRDTIPDLGDLIAWMLKRAGAAEKKLAAAVEQQKTDDSRIDELSNGIRAYRDLADGRPDDILENCWWTRRAVAWEKDHGGRVLASCDTPSPDKSSSEATTRQPSHFVGLAAAALAVCNQNGWKRDWQHGGAYLHLEASEFVEALRGKGDSTPEAEAADVLFVLLSVCAANQVSIEKALSHLRELCHLPDGRIDVESGAIYLIQDSRTYVGDDVSWWRPNSEGYTCQIDEAGLYNEAFARNRRDTDKVYRAADIYPLATRVVDIQRIHSAGVKPVTFPKDSAR